MTLLVFLFYFTSLLFFNNVKDRIFITLLFRGKSLLKKISCSHMWLPDAFRNGWLTELESFCKILASRVIIIVDLKVLFFEL